MKPKINITPDIEVLKKYIPKDLIRTSVSSNTIEISKALLSNHNLKNLKVDNLAAFVFYLGFIIGASKIGENLELPKFLRDQNNDSVKLKKELVKIFGKKPSRNEIADLISEIQISFNGKKGRLIKTKSASFILALIPKIEKAIKFEGNQKTKPVGRETVIIKSLSPFGAFLIETGILKNRNQVYEFIRELLQCWSINLDTDYIRHRINLP